MRELSTLLIAGALVVGLAAPAAAQKKFLGAKVGFVFANHGGDVETGEDNPGFSVGGVFGYKLRRTLEIQLEVEYVQKGTQERNEGVLIKLNHPYLEILVPLTLIIPVENSDFRLRLYGAPNVAFELSCRFVATDFTDTESADCADERIGFETRSVDFGVAFGLGADIPLGPGALTLDGRYDIGLTNINTTTPPRDAVIKNRVWQFLAGYLFWLGD